MDNATWVNTAVKAAYQGMAIGQPGGFGGQDATSGLQTGAFGAANAFTNFKDETYTQLVQAAGSEIDPAKRKQLYSQINDLILDQSFTMNVELVPGGVGCVWQGPRRAAGADRRRTDSGGRLVGLVEHTEGARVKLGFWTLYDVDWTNEEIAQRAAALGYQGVDLRVTSPGKTPGIGENLSLDSSDEEIARTRSAFDRGRRRDLEPELLQRQPAAGDAAAYAAFEKEIVAHAELARKSGTREFGSRSPKGRPRVCPGRAISSTSGGLLAGRWMAFPA